MGMRQNIKILYSTSVVDTPANRAIDEKNAVYLYSHWDGENGMSPLKMKLKNALIRGKDRWSDESYLARIIFSEMIKKDIDGLTGYGIAPYPVDEEYPTIVVDIPTNKVDGISFDEFTK